MGLVLQHIQRTESGSFIYRRRIPKDLATIIQKREFKKKLGATEAEALKIYPQFHAQVEREIAGRGGRWLSAPIRRQKEKRTRPHCVGRGRLRLM